MSEVRATATDATGGSWLLTLRPATRLTAEVCDPAPSMPRHLTMVKVGERHPLGSGDLVEAGGQTLLVCTTPVDWPTLFARDELRSAVPGLSELPLLLGQRDHVTPDFRSLVSDISYDLGVFRKFFDQQDAGFATEPAAVRETARRHLFSRAGPVFHAALDAFLVRLERAVQAFTPDQHAAHGFYLRQQLWTFLMSAPFSRRTNLKPRGYAGDAVMMQMIYDEQPEGDSSFAQLLHLHPVSHPAAQAVRNRRVMVPAALRARLSKTEGPFRVLSVACGPARELEELFHELPGADRVELALLDQDEEALAAARRTVDAIPRLGARATFHASSVRTLLRTAELQRSLGQFQFIYSMGLFDYLTRPVARAVLERLYELLAPGGMLFVGNYHDRNPSRFYMAYWLDWSLYHRSEDEFLALASGLGEASITYDASRAQMFLSVEKPR